MNTRPIYTCPVCAGAIIPAKRGRPPIYCSTPCRREAQNRREKAERRAFKLAKRLSVWDQLGTEHHEYYEAAEKEFAALVAELKGQP